MKIDLEQESLTLLVKLPSREQSSGTYVYLPLATLHTPIYYFQNSRIPLFTGNTVRYILNQLVTTPKESNMPSEKTDTLVKPEIQDLIDRGNVTWEEYEVLYMNSYERSRLYAVLTPEALCKVGHQALSHIPLKGYPTTYEDVIISLLFPLALTRLQETLPQFPGKE